MQRIRHFEQCDYIIPIGQKIEQALVLSNQSNCYLRTTRDQAFNPALYIHAKFNSSTMNGISVECRLSDGNKNYSFFADEFDLYRVADGSYTKTFIDTFSLSPSGTTFIGTVLQSDIGSNELSGAETYYIEVSANRKFKKYYAGAYFNHFGCFDSLNRLRNYVEYLMIDKVDD